MYEFLSIVLIVFGVLQIILFFKMWGMTNNVKKIKEKYFEEAEVRKQEKENRLTPSFNEPNTSKETAPNRETSQKLHTESAIETRQTPTKPTKHYDLAEKDINKLKVLKKRGFIEQANNEFISLTSASKEDASSYIYYL